MTLDLFGLDINSVDLRRDLAPRHPMMDQGYLIVTPEIEALHDVVFDWVVARKSGLFIAGLHRQGKSKALEYILNLLRDELPFMAFLRCDAKRLASQTKPQFCADILRQFGYAADLLKKGRAEEILEHFFLTACARAGGKHCVLFVDEAQLWTVTQYRYLLEIWNRVRNEGCILSTVLVGQESLPSLRTLTGNLDHGAVVARFFVKMHKFSGVRDITALSEILTSYDEKLFYPEESDWSYSRYFLQQAFDDGWRLERETLTFWTALKEVAGQRAGAAKRTGFRTAWVIDAIHSFLLDGMKNDGVDFQGSQTRWAECLLSGTSEDLII